MANEKGITSAVRPSSRHRFEAYKKGLQEVGHSTILLPPDLSQEEIISKIIESQVDTVLISRTLGYGLQRFCRFIDLADAAGLRDNVRFALGGMAITPKLAAELGFDAGFGPKQLLKKL